MPHTKPLPCHAHCHAHSHCHVHCHAHCHAHELCHVPCHTRSPRPRISGRPSPTLLGLLATLLLCSLVPSHRTERSVAADEPAVETTQPALKILTHNVWYGFTRKTQPRYDQWLPWVKQQAADVVVLQELNDYTPERLAREAATWGHPYSELLKEDGFATGITARYPIDEVRRLRDGFHHGLLRGRIHGIWFYVIHFHPSNFARRVAEAGLLEADVKSLPDPEPAIVLVGDFNGFSPADKPHYDQDAELVRFFERLDQRDPNARNLNAGQLDYGGIQAILAQGYTDTVAHFRGPNEPFVGTFPTALVNDEDHGTDRRLDYIFVSPNLLPHVVSATILRDELTQQLSDHLPVTATLRWPTP